ncbi:MAG: hypothetical protein AB7G80_07150 [Dongiaceae bacterium]
MRLRSFTAATMQEAMRQVREALGEDAIIVTSGPATGGQGIQVTAAIDTSIVPAESAETPAPELVYVDPIDVVGEAFDKMGVPRKLADRLLKTLGRLEIDDPIMALAGTLDAEFRFTAINFAKPVFLVGLPGVGKTVTIAKLAAQLVIQGKKPVCITTDSLKTGGYEQLQYFTNILKIDLLRAGNKQELTAAIAKYPPNTPILIDTSGINILKNEELEHLKDLLKATDGEIILVYGAGGDALDAFDIGVTFKEVGAAKMIVTRLDMTRRFGSVLAVADAGKLAFSQVSITPLIAEGLNPINPVSLARLILPDIDNLNAINTLRRRAS